MILHRYHKETGEYIESFQARPDPKDEGRYLKPAGSTDVTPPEPGPNQQCVFDGADWQLVDDYRGTRYWIENNFGIEITELGIAPPVYATLVEPPNLDVVLDNGTWRDKTPAEVDVEKENIASNFSDVKNVALAMMRVNYQNSAELQAAFPTFAAYRNAVKDEFKSRL